MMSCFWRHDWGKWMDRFDGEKTYDDNGTRRVIGKIVIQERRCARCGKVQRHIEETTIDI